jgi:hypothetical protein
MGSRTHGWVLVFVMTRRRTGRSPTLWTGRSISAVTPVGIRAGTGPVGGTATGVGAQAAGSGRAGLLRGRGCADRWAGGGRGLGGGGRFPRGCRGLPRRGAAAPGARARGCRAGACCAGGRAEVAAPGAVAPGLPRHGRRRRGSRRRGLPRRGVPPAVGGTLRGCPPRQAAPSGLRLRVRAHRAGAALPRALLARPGRPLSSDYRSSPHPARRSGARFKAPRRSYRRPARRRRRAVGGASRPSTPAAGSRRGPRRTRRLLGRRGRLPTSSATPAQCDHRRARRRQPDDGGQRSDRLTCYAEVRHRLLHVAEATCRSVKPHQTSTYVARRARAFWPGRRIFDSTGSVARSHSAARSPSRALQLSQESAMS